ncbi:MAG TPA: formate dehydrogenase accessory protein FdhE [Candidatus Acidoferrum sp.]|nr:formate dehydrogenase accessory protein FdhE [Candidatus Acidoferrum sp.]
MNRIERADELARRYPISAELMYFFRDIARFQTTLGTIDAAPLRAFIRRDPADPMAAFCTRVLEGCAPVADAWRDACAACGGPLHTYASAEFAHIRVEACDSCGTYVKAVDLAQDPSAVPEVDDLASVPLDLWAAEHGYRKSSPNLFGL